MTEVMKGSSICFEIRNPLFNFRIRKTEPWITHLHLFHLQNDPNANEIKNHLNAIKQMAL